MKTKKSLEKIKTTPFERRRHLGESSTRKMDLLRIKKSHILTLTWKCTRMNMSKHWRCVFEIEFKHMIQICLLNHFGYKWLGTKRVS